MDSALVQMRFLICIELIKRFLDLFLSVSSIGVERFIFFLLLVHIPTACTHISRAEGMIRYLSWSCVFYCQEVVF